MTQMLHKYLLPVVVSFMTYFSASFSMMLAIGFFVACDFITGILASQKRNEEIASKKMRATVTKGIGYMVAIMIANVFQNQFLPGIEVMKIISGLIALIELKSVDENIRVITGKSIFKQFLKR